MDQWHTLKIELHQEAEAIFNSLGEIVLVNSSGDLDVTLVSRTKHLKVTYIPDRNAVRWETPKEHGFEPIPMLTAPLAIKLMERVHQR
jgi:hypothetical protein